MLLRQVLQKIIKAALKELLAADDGTRVPRYEQALKSAILTPICQKKRSAGNVCFRENQVLGESKLTISEGIISEHNNRYHLPPSFLSPLQVYHLCVLYRTQYLFSHYPSPKTNTTKTA